ncbi:hypothetical protein L249_4921 [Ophiocordyceps polyrhachis-furcata BCC 54312]|uniref:HMG box domain-containing protein n=1 Tax=Ophiocordyceps polyrhachis-furcata BCC 54312 TaxID=1330021 RepID=A0A367L398_9HYPO|nr:hypothetical protein L249_4921 [Ophiocordyceps polyrhachis-furcata BCC 54312]
MATWEDSEEAGSASEASTEASMASAHPGSFLWQSLMLAPRGGHRAWTTTVQVAVRNTSFVAQKGLAFPSRAMLTQCPDIVLDLDQETPLLLIPFQCEHKTIAPLGLYWVLRRSFRLKDNGSQRRRIASTKTPSEQQCPLARTGLERQTTARASMVHPPLSPASSIDMRAGTHHLGELHRLDPSNWAPGLPCGGGGLMAYTPRPEVPRSMVSRLEPEVDYSSPAPYPGLSSRRDASGFVMPLEYSSTTTWVRYKKLTSVAQAHAPFTPETSPLLSTDGEEYTTASLDPIVSKKSCFANSHQRHSGRVEKRRKPPRIGLKPGVVTQFVQLDKPLSQHMKDKGDADIFDVTAHVHRETRKSEVAEGGKVKRPLNAFLLYRKHVIVFIKKTFLAEENKNNQQVVSRICGDSWKMETDEIKAKFKKLAQEEKKMHGKAFPGYKYTPKTGKKPENEADGTKPENSLPKSPSASTVAGPGDSVASSHAVRESQPPTYRPPSQTAMQNSRADDGYSSTPRSAQQQLLHYPGYNDDFACNWNQEGLQPQAYDYCLMQPRQLPVAPAEAYIDPTFLPSMEEPVYHWHSTDDVIPGHQGWHPQNYSLNEMGMTMPDLDINGAHSAYLRGAQDDWEIEQLGDSGTFNNWMMQEENTDRKDLGDVIYLIFAEEKSERARIAMTDCRCLGSLRRGRLRDTPCCYTYPTPLFPSDIFTPRLNSAADDPSSITRIRVSSSRFPALRHRQFVIAHGRSRPSLSQHENNNQSSAFALEALYAIASTSRGRRLVPDLSAPLFSLLARGPIPNAPHFMVQARPHGSLQPMGSAAQYGVIIDAGSSGTRIYVYKWLSPSVATQRASTEDLRSLPKLKLKSSKKIHPGVSVFAEKAASVGPEHLESLVQLAVDEVPAAKIPDTPIFLLATAGVRLLAQQAQTALLQEICSYFQTKTRFYLPDCKSHIQVISGETEGLYGWIAANYLLGGFDHPAKHDHGKDHHTYGFLDMGGASAQVAFAPNNTESEKHADDLKLVRMRHLDGSPLEYRVFTASWLGFGANKARSRYIESLVESYGSSVTEVPDPCLPKGLRTSLTGEPRTSEGSPGDRLLVGTGAFKECLLKTFPLLRKDAPCKDRPCLLNGQHAPAIDFDVNHFVGVSEYWHMTHGAFGKEYNEYDFVKYQDAVSEHCNRDWAGIEADLKKHGHKAEKKVQTAQEACFKACWVINMLHDGIGIPRDNLDGGIGNNATKNSADKAKIDPFQPIHKVGGVQVTWTLGKMVLYATGQIPPDPSSSSSSSSLPVGIGSNAEAGVLADDFEKAGSVPLAWPPASDLSGERDGSRTLEVIIILLLALVCLLFLVGYCLRKREWRRRTRGLFQRRRQYGYGRKVPRGSSSLISKLFWRAPATYERILDEGDESQLELGDVDPDDYDCSDTSCSPRLGNVTTPILNVDRFDDLRPPSEMDRNGLVIRTESHVERGPEEQSWKPDAAEEPSDDASGRLMSFTLLHCCLHSLSHYLPLTSLIDMLPLHPYYVLCRVLPLSRNSSRQNPRTFSHDMADGDDVQNGSNSTDDVVEETSKGKGKAIFAERLQASGKAAFKAVTGTSTMPDIVPEQKTATAGPSNSTTHLEEASSRRAVQTGPAEPFRMTRPSSDTAFSSFIETPAQDSRPAQPSSSAIADQEAADGSAVTHLLSLPDEEIDEYDTAEEQIPPHEAARLRQALFANIHGHTTWNQLLDFTPDSLTPLPDEPPSAHAASRLHLVGTGDAATARSIWLHQWSDVFDSYTRDVWGDLGHLAADAKAEVERSISGAEMNRETKALQRLRLVLAHLRGSFFFFPRLIYLAALLGQRRNQRCLRQRRRRMTTTTPRKFNNMKHRLLFSVSLTAFQSLAFSAAPTITSSSLAAPLLARAQCPPDTFQCPAYLGPDICCQNGQTCALDAHNSPACCPAGAVCTGTAPAGPPQTAAVSYVPNQFFSYPYAATSFDNSASCASAIHACSSNYDACVTGLQRDAAYAVTVNVPGGQGLTVSPSQRHLGTSATAICSSLSSQACGKLQATRCEAYGQRSAAASIGFPPRSALWTISGLSIVFSIRLTL